MTEDDARKQESQAHLSGLEFRKVHGYVSQKKASSRGWYNWMKCDKEHKEKATGFSVVTKVFEHRFQCEVNQIWKD